MWRRNVLTFWRDDTQHNDIQDTLSIKGLIATFGMMAQQHSTNVLNVAIRSVSFLFIVILNAIMLSVVVVSVVAQTF
jgi:hypothetical protein